MTMVESESYQYVKYGKTDGRLENIPESSCRKCGKLIQQPLPTGIWMHSGKSDFTDNEKHTAVPSTLVEQLMVYNREHSYADVECALHRKYWSNQTDLTKPEIEKILGKENSEPYDPWFTAISTRENSMAFKDFVRKSKEKYLKKNMPSPKYYVVINLKVGRGMFKVRHEQIAKIPYSGNTGYYGLNWANKLVKWNGKLYLVSGDCLKSKVSASEVHYKATIHKITPKEQEKIDFKKPEIVMEIST